jgi:hypothetical protein
MAKATAHKDRSILTKSKGASTRRLDLHVLDGAFAVRAHAVERSAADHAKSAI